MGNSNNNQPKLKERRSYTKNALLELFEEDERLANEMEKIIDKKQNRTAEDMAEFDRIASLSDEISKKVIILKAEWKAEWLEMMKKDGI